MRAYIIRRLLLMVPALFGITLVTFLVMQLAPGDPLKNQLSQTGSQGTSSVTREAYLLQRRHWKLDRPAFLNHRWFHDYSADACHYARLCGMNDAALDAGIERMSAKPDPEMLRFLRGLGIESFDARLADPGSRKELARAIRIGVQIRAENMGEHAVRPLVDILRASTDLKAGAIRCLSMATLGDPFTYTYSREPLPEETDAIVSTWRLWWTRQHGHPPLSPERRAEVESRFEPLAQEPSRRRIIGGMKAFTAADAPFFIEVLQGPSSLKKKMVASLALHSTIGKPLRSDVRLSDPPARIDEVAANWIAYADGQTDRFDPTFLARLGRFFADTQYANSVVKLVTFNFGKSMVSPYDAVGPKIWRAAAVSAPLMLFAEMLVYLIAVPAGILCAVRRGRWLDRIISLGLFLLYSIPSYVAAMLFLVFLCYGTDPVFPMDGLHSEGMENASFLAATADYLWHACLPVVCLSVFSVAGLAMYSRSSMLDIINQDYIRTARAKGLSEVRVILKHALRNALIPVITLFSSFLPALLGGSVLVEVLFGIPGMGRMSYESILAKDYNTLMALFYIDAIIVLLSILMTDLLYVVVDPRISFERSEAAA